MHHLDAHETHRERTRRESHKNATYYLEQILEATPYKTAAVRPPASHLTNYPSEMNKTC